MHLSNNRLFYGRAFGEHVVEVKRNYCYFVFNLLKNRSRSRDLFAVACGNINNGIGVDTIIGLATLTF